LGLAFGRKKWSLLAKRGLAQQTLSQIYEDGFDYEASTAYHRMVLEILLYFTVAQSRPLMGTGLALNEGDGAKREMGESFVERLSSMVRICLQLADSGGKVPLIGDNDSGRVIHLSDRPATDVRAIADIGALLFKEKNFRIKEWERTSEAAWAFGIAGVKQLQALEGRTVGSISPKTEGISGLRVLRGAQDVLVFSGQPNGTKGLGNHTHNDKLSLTLSVAGRCFIGDPGSAVYTSDLNRRNLYRSVQFHNTVGVDGEEQNRFDRKGFFGLHNDAHVTFAGCNSSSIVAEHSGYRRLEGHVIHRRSIVRSETSDGRVSWIVTDEIKGEGTHGLDWTFVMAPGVEVAIEGAGFLMKSGPESMTLRSLNSELAFQIVPGNYSEEYGSESKAHFFEGSTKDRPAV